MNAVERSSLRDTMRDTRRTNPSKVAAPIKVADALDEGGPSALTRRISIFFADEVYRAMKHISIDDDITLSATVDEALRFYLKSRESS